MNLYPLGKALVSIIFYPLYRIRVIGKENMPKDNGVLLCSNHIDNLDPPTVGITSPRLVNFMAKEELFEAPILKGLLPKLQAFPVKRGASDRQAIRKALQLLKSGEVVGLFPEGTRSTTGELGEGMAGAGFLALRGECDVVPCAIIGPYKPFKRLTVIYGQPLPMKELRERKASAEEVTQIIMQSIQNLIDTHKNIEK
ncbi:1-acyl-sn-glycerol-3-phosphate acyltransferase [Savagea sp. SN6]|uniref:1-acyl-sn-glycerol-3-phosphate acyltransferase n=1 Tax=Savagea serpentis TaxID=2785297 RepID=A0A8J7G0T0_9BACL|nr:lysophospholipid acyltransferase family protein [Savagea serpentis]MBF4500065.1 1-acyl-sn-glycerol-3-phosphate acyltransferase [Savagea serpentis]